MYNMQNDERIPNLAAEFKSPASRPMVYPFSIRLFILSTAARIQAMQKPCRTRF